MLNSTLFFNIHSAIANLAGGTMFVVNSTLRHNGGGIYNNFYGTLTVRNSTISDNSRGSSPSGTYGGGIYNAGTATVENSTLSGNTADYGGGIANDDSGLQQGVLTIRNSTLSGNKANKDGGGIFNAGMATIENSTLSDNTALDFDRHSGTITNVSAGNPAVVTSSTSHNLTTGMFVKVSGVTGTGNITNANTTTTVTQTFSHLLFVLDGVDTTGGTYSSGGTWEVVSGHGGGIYNGANNRLAQLHVHNSTIARNRALDTGGGIFANDTALTALSNTIVADNFKGEGTTTHDDVNGTVGASGTSVTLDRNNWISTFARYGGQFTSWRDDENLTLYDESSADFIELVAEDREATAGASVDVVATFQVRTTVPHDADAGNRVLITDGVSKTAWAACIIKDGVRGIGLLSTGSLSDSDSYPVFVPVDWMAAPVTIRLRRHANGDAELVEVNGVAPSPMALLTADQLPGPVYDRPSVGFGTRTAPETQSTVEYIAFRSEVLSGVSFNNLVGVDTGLSGMSDGLNGNQIGTATMPIDPRLGPLVLNGGPTKTHALRSGSPAIDQGDNAQVPGGTTTDQRGSPFLRIANTTVDIGAYEVQNISPIHLEVDSTDDEYDFDFSAGHLSLREAIGLAHAGAGDAITFSPTVFATPQTISLLRQLDINRSLSITGPGADLLTLKGTQHTRGFYVDDGNGLADLSVTISGLSVFDSWARDASGLLEKGGGIYNAENLALRYVTLSGNQAYDGGGIYNAGTLTIKNSTLWDNHGFFGGGIYNAGTLTAQNCTLSGNSAIEGGGIFNSATLTLRNSTVTQNHASLPGVNGRGGAGLLTEEASSLTLHNTIVAQNFTPSGAFSGFDRPDDVNGPVESMSSFNLIGVDSGLGGISHGTNGNRIGTAAAPINPRLGPLADNGGPTLTHALIQGSCSPTDIACIPSSPAIDAGNNAEVPADMTTDQRGGSFARIANDTVDIGAFEVQGNRPPVANDDSATTDEDAAITIDVLTNDSDADGDPLTMTAVTVPMHGTAMINPDGTVTYTPDLNFHGSDTFTYTTSDGAGGSATATVFVEVRNLVDVSGRVFDDKDNDGLYEPGDGDAGIGGVSVELFHQTSGVLIANRTTAPDGVFFFDVNLGAGTYKVVAAQPAGFLDGRETAGNIGGTVDNTQDSNQISGLGVDEPGTTADAIDYLFAEIGASQALGLVWGDFNNDGEVNFSDKVIPGVAIELSGLDDRGQSVSRSATSDANGVYAFLDLRPSDAAGYTIREIQPADYADGLDSLGQVNGVAVGDNSVNDTFSGVVLPRTDSLAENYNFAERPPADSAVEQGQTAPIGYWQNNNGQNLIHSLNGGSTATQLGSWLAATFPNMYGAFAGVNNLAGRTNAEVAEFYKTLFARTGAGGGPAKLDAQVMATALAVYVTNQTLAGTTAASCGFLVTENGVGTRTFNVADNGAAFGVADNSNVTVLDLLLAVSSRSRHGLLYDLDGDGDATDALETSYRTMANSVFRGINEAGGI